MQVRKARYEKPSTLVRDFNPEVERFIARALRADRSRRWQSAEQMADRIDAILLKLGQTTGPSTLKRWLDNLSAKDGAKPPAEVAEQSSTSGTIELGSRDLELEEVAPSAETAEAGDESNEEQAATRAAKRPALSPARPEPPAPAAYAAYGVNVNANADARPRGADRSRSVPSASAAGAVMNEVGPSAVAAPPPSSHMPATVTARMSRAVVAPPAGGELRRLVTIVVTTVALLGASAYLGRQFIFTRWLHPLESWLQQRLPVPVPAPDWTGDPRDPEPTGRR